VNEEERRKKMEAHMRCDKEANTHPSLLVHYWLLKETGAI
jgi:hypothetical protein